VNKLRRLIGNTVISLLGQGVTWASTLILTGAYGRYLGATLVGELNTALTVVMLIGFPLEFGFNQQLTRDVAQDHNKAMRYLSTTLLLKFLLWPLLYLGVVFYTFVLKNQGLDGYSGDVFTLVSICGVTLLSGSIANTFGALHNAFEQQLYPALGTIIEKACAAVAGVILLHEGAGVVIMAYVLLASSVGNMFWQALNSFRLHGMRFSVTWQAIRELATSSVPFLIYGALGVLYYRMGTVQLSYFAEQKVVGWFTVSYRLFDTLVFLPNIVILAVMYPVLSKLSATTDERTTHKMAVEKSTNFLFFSSLPIATLMIMTAPHIIGFLYGNSRDFDQSIPVLQMLAPGLVFLYLNTIMSTTLVSIKQEKKITVIAGIALVFNFTLNLIMIHLWLHIGAALVTSLTELLLLVLTTACVPRHLWPWKSLTVGVKAALACVVMGSVIFLLQRFSILIILPASGITYLVAAILLRTIPRQDIQALVQAVRNRKQHPNPEMLDTLPLPALDTLPTLPAIRVTPKADEFDTETPTMKLPGYASSHMEEETQKIVIPARPRRRLPHTPRPKLVPDTPREALENGLNLSGGEVR
jgi:O-antigen/teichoic acid export membrane protein